MAEVLLACNVSFVMLFDWVNCEVTVVLMVDDDGISN
jgi:hypothetical protein